VVWIGEKYEPSGCGRTGSFPQAEGPDEVKLISVKQPAWAIPIEVSMKTFTEQVKIDDDLIDKGDPYAIIDPVWWIVSIYDGEQRYNDDLKSFSQAQRYLFAVIWYMAEVNNGGHDQFYFNSTGIVWKDALAGFKVLGIYAAAEIVQESAVRMGGNPSLDRYTRQGQLDAYEPDFDDLDTRFYELEKTTGTTPLKRGMAKDFTK